MPSTFGLVVFSLLVLWSSATRGACPQDPDRQPNQRSFSDLPLKCAERRQWPECLGSSLFQPLSGHDLTVTRNMSHVVLSKWLIGTNTEGLDTATLERLLPPLPFIGTQEAVGSCGVVSSNSKLLGSGLGDRIDRHEVVLRFNDAPTAGFEQDVGRKTSIRYTNYIYEGLRRETDEAVIGSWCTKKPCDEARLLRLIHKKVHALNPDFVQWIKNDYWTVNHHIPTSGFVGIVLMMYYCKSVTIYGFALQDTWTDTGQKTRMGLKAWYYEKRNITKDLKKGDKRHRMMKDDAYVPTWKYAVENNIPQISRRERASFQQARFLGGEESSSESSRRRRLLVMNGGRSLSKPQQGAHSIQPVTKKYKLTGTKPRTQSAFQQKKAKLKQDRLAKGWGPGTRFHFSAQQTKRTTHQGTTIGLEKRCLLEFQRLRLLNSVDVG